MNFAVTLDAVFEAAFAQARLVLQLLAQVR
jgi:hypothetical protein